MRKYLILILLVATVLCGFKFKDADLTSRDVSKMDPDADNPTGSAWYLDGDTLLVSIYLDDFGATWTKKEYDHIEDNMQIATNYLSKCGAKYGKYVNLVYDLSPDSDLCYRMDFASEFDSSDGWENDDSNKIFNAVEDFIANEIPTKTLRQKYGINSIAYIVFADTSTDIAITCSYYYSNNVKLKGNSYNEYCIIPTYFGDNALCPHVYAHEFLHLFGARDLYMSNNINGISREVVDYAFDRYPKDIMLGYSASGVDWNKKISLKVTDLTAYFLGWKDYIIELDMFPDIKENYVGVFEFRENVNENEWDYKVKSRLVSQSSFLELFFGISFFVFFFVFEIIMYRANKKKKAMLKDVIYWYVFNIDNINSASVDAFYNNSFSNFSRKKFDKIINDVISFCSENNITSPEQIRFK